jgi:hypothetical protein
MTAASMRDSSSSREIVRICKSSSGSRTPPVTATASSIVSTRSSSRSSRARRTLLTDAGICAPGPVRWSQGSSRISVMRKGLPSPRRCSAAASRWWSSLPGRPGVNRVE